MAVKSVDLPERGTPTSPTSFIGRRAYQPSGPQLPPFGPCAGGGVRADGIPETEWGGVPPDPLRPTGSPCMQGLIPIRSRLRPARPGTVRAGRGIRRPPPAWAFRSGPQVGNMGRRRGLTPVGKRERPRLSPRPFVDEPVRPRPLRLRLPEDLRDLVDRIQELLTLSRVLGLLRLARQLRGVPERVVQVRILLEVLGLEVVGPQH